MINLESTVQKVKELMLLRNFAKSAEDLICRPVFQKDLLITGDNMVAVNEERAIVLTGLRGVAGLRAKIYKGDGAICIAWLSSDIPLITDFPILLPGTQIRYVLDNDLLYVRSSPWYFSGYVVELLGDHIYPNL